VTGFGSERRGDLLANRGVIGEMAIGTPSISSGSETKITAERKRHEIASAAAELFNRSGYAMTTMDHIAKAVNLAKPTLYHYFRSKDSILTCIHEEVIDLLLHGYDARAKNGLPPDEMLLEVMADTLGLMHTHRGHMGVFFEYNRELSPASRRKIWRKRDRYLSLVEGLFEQGIADGYFRVLDVSLAVQAMFGMCNWAYHWYRSDGPLSTPEIAYEFWGYLIHGFGSSARLNHPLTRAGGVAPTTGP
jgi:TetR/AcrR family transcriptional regulator, cholesterol catabolism regulator